MINSLNFSQRMGYTPKVKEIQINSIDEDLRNRLWNTVKFYYWDVIEDIEVRKRVSVLPKISNLIWHHFLKLPVDSKPQYPIIDLRNQFFNDFTWNKIYDFIEFLLKVDFEFLCKEDIMKAVNIVLEEEFAGYRLNEGIFVPITNEIELEEVKDVSTMVINFPQFHSVGLHMSSALEKLSDRNNPDYRNSIKESISAVEALCRQLTSENTLEKALSKLESKGVKINNEFKKGLEKLYGYTNTKESGIRHAIIGNHIEPRFEEAKFMLVSCSAFVNYLIGISRENNI